MHEKPEKNVMSYPPRDPNESILAGGTIQAVLYRGIVIGIVVIIQQLSIIKSRKKEKNIQLFLKRI